MKKALNFILSLAMGLATLLPVVSLHADFLDGNGPPNVSKYGDKLFANGGLSYGVNPADVVTDFVPAFSDVAIAVGDVVVISGGTTYLVSVSKTTTTADTGVLGIAATATTAAGQTLLVRTHGICRANIPTLTVTKKDFLVTSGTAGQITGSAVTTYGLYTPLSRSALVGTALETCTACTNPVLIYLNGR